MTHARTERSAGFGLRFEDLDHDRRARAARTEALRAMWAGLRRGLAPGRGLAPSRGR